MDSLNALALAAQSQAPASGGDTMFFPMLIIIAVIFYLVILRPQRREQQKIQAMRDSLKRGDRVKSIGGIHGTVTLVDETKGTVKVRVDKSVELEFDKAAIATVFRKDEEKSASEAKGSSESGSTK